VTAGPGPRRAAPFLPALAAGLAALAVLLLAWRRLLVDGLVPVDGNVLCVTFPNWRLARDLWLHGSLPLWNPLRSLGTPYLADPITMALYPVQWLLSALPDFAGFTRAWVVVHTLLAGIFWAALARRWHGRAGAGLLEPVGVTAGLVGTLNAFVMVRVVFPHCFAAAAWVPAILYFQETGAMRALAAAFAMQWLAGYPSYSVLTVLLCLALAGLRGREGLALLARAGALALGLAAVQLVPFVEFLLRSSRGVLLDPSFAGQFSIPASQLLKSLALPQWYLLKPAMAGDPAMECFYVGLPALILAGWGAWKGGTREQLLAGAVGACLLISLGAHLPGYESLPFLHFFRFPNNWLLLAAAGLTLLAAAGIGRIQRPAWAWPCVGLIAVDLLIFAQAPKSAWGRPAFLTDVPPLAKQAEPMPPGTRILHTDRLLELWSASRLETEEDYLLMKEHLAPSYGMAFGLSEVSSLQTMRPALAERYRRRLAGPEASPDLLDWAGIGIVIDVEPGLRKVGRGNLTVEQRATARDRIFIEGSSGRRVKDLSHAPGLASGRVDGPAVAVFAETRFPGWRATIDGKPASLRAWQETFMAVDVPPGRHDVAFSYKPLSFKLGFLGTMAALLLTLAPFLRRKLR
jgi:hypothetical protein